MSRARAVLVISSESQLRSSLVGALRAQSYQVVEVVTGGDGLVTVASRVPRIVLLDAELPDMDWIEVVRRVRAQSNVPIIVISGRDDDKNQISAFDSGANDYVTKPVRQGVLLARMRAILRDVTSTRREPSALVVGALRVDPVQKRAWVRGIEVSITLTEFRLLAALMQDAGRVVTHQQLLRQVWGASHARDIQYLRVYMKQLRDKLERDPAQPELFLTSPGVGYRLHVID